MYRSLFETIVADLLTKKKVPFGYETKVVRFVQPPKKRQYKPDFEIYGTGILIETKGRLTAADRAKLKWVKEQHPKLKIALLFQRSENKINKRSKTTYAQWAEAEGFMWADSRNGVPNTWIKPQT